MKRINYIDISKAIAILFIVLGHTIVHSANCGIIYKFIYSFHVSLFFIISGYTFKIRDNYCEYIKNRFKRLVIPYFVWTILFLIPYLIFGSSVANDININSTFNIKKLLLNIIYGNGNNMALKQNSSLWFLPALFSIEIIYYWIIKLNGKLNQIKQIILFILLIIISYISANYLKIYLPWGINTVLVMGILFYTGYLLKYLDLLNKKIIFKLEYILIIAIIGIIASISNNAIEPIEYQYGNVLLTLTSGLCLSLLFIYIAYLINKNRYIEYIGRNTMGILIFHKLIILIFQTKLGVVSNILNESNAYIELLLGIFISLIAIVFSVVITKIIKKILPFIIGERS